MTAWRRILIYLGLVEPPPGTDAGRQIIPWWAQLGLALFLALGSAMALSSGPGWWGVLQLLMAIYLIVDALRRRRRR